LNFLTGILNSTLLQFYFEYAVSDGLNVYPDDVRYLPIVKSRNQSNLAERVEKISRLKERRSELNLSLLDYLGNYANGPRLADTGLFQPTDINILNSTADEYDSLQINRVKTKSDGNKVTIFVSVRYKPENEDEYETDTYGYTETDFKKAFSLIDLSNEEATLVESFVPVAVEKADGFADFRDYATKTNSLIDRLKVITLPDSKDVAEELRRYMATKQRANELDEEIEKTDHLIDAEVYDLYDLTEEEREVVTSSVDSNNSGS
jgi:hypothetical protein